MVRYVSPIDPHVHLRWREYAEKDFLRIGLSDAGFVGLAAVIEQPNTDPPLVSIETVKERRELVDKCSACVRYSNHIGLTAVPEQIRQALSIANEGILGVRSVKVFYGHSTGGMEISDPTKQKMVWHLQGRYYKGVTIGHFEAEDLFDKNVKFDPTKPVTHSQIRTEESETMQVERQLRNAIDSKFEGIFYVAHASSPHTIDFVERERKRVPFKIVVETTFHHMFLNWEDYAIHGNLVKMNPPLRPKEQQERLLERVFQGKTDIIGTDHAPHPLERKTSDNPPSGIPALPFWPRAISLLKIGGMSEENLARLTFGTANEIFKLGIEPKVVDVEYDPDRWNVYGWNPFSRIDGRLV